MLATTRKNAKTFLFKKLISSCLISRIASVQNLPAQEVSQHNKLHI